MHSQFYKSDDDFPVSTCLYPQANSSQILVCTEVSFRGKIQLRNLIFGGHEHIQENILEVECDTLL